MDNSEHTEATPKEEFHAATDWYVNFMGTILTMADDAPVKAVVVKDGIVYIELVGGLVVDFTVPQIKQVVD